MADPHATPSNPAPPAYQVLARKWRPRAFADLVGQTHVVQALTNALTRGQLHHAYLFTGTRGVGKTTLARILAKALNCEQGISATPCGICTTCQEIDAGRFLDLLEVDAASRTKVDQTRELLENVPFAPVRGRYKVYLIDEVHMFSGHSFNALLKTLEEPPPHVKFVLATTDPQKLPPTVLSRCLQFNLKPLLPEQIQGQFRRILAAEAIGYDEQALYLLAHAADGSMRDGLSLLDQAIAFGGGQLTVADVRAMLGTLDQDVTLTLVEALCAGDGARLLAEIGRVADLTPDFAGVLRTVIELLHRLALIQQVPSVLAADDPDAERLRTVATAAAAEDLQLYYQIALLGQQDLAWAPSPRAGLEMVLLRALAFRPDDAPAAAPSATAPMPSSAAATVASSPRPPAPSPASISPAIANEPVITNDPGGVVQLTNDHEWRQLLQRLRLTGGGLSTQLAQHCAFHSWENNRLCLVLDADQAHLRQSAETRLLEILKTVLGAALKLDIIPRNANQTSAIAIASTVLETPANYQQKQIEQNQQLAEQILKNDPVGQELEEKLDAKVIPGTVKLSDA
ncbi:DNA polymerase III subunit gamma/tau [Rhodoferax sp. 4810]|uniref:DNA polymerase III subunit gamma/tau n=1 Tax=Thiospirillum jenense TaxID=1653858 RepID=A0A839HCW6_9GAMM|nr:DNA polymerase III subunit gamma/tau [Thiospirillum jenense]MBB1075417.1 DNA polymerase III subunit gamma/tau [Rhodoferax jenense]MBB1126795.1 DNA polymerase III subunit gamma/tau [Thiospirillum jenense]